MGDKEKLLTQDGTGSPCMMWPEDRGKAEREEISEQDKRTIGTKRTIGKNVRTFRIGQMKTYGGRLLLEFGLGKVQRIF